MVSKRSGCLTEVAEVAADGKPHIVSIVTPSYNQAVFLEDALKSVLTQEGDSFYIDYLVIDGGSVDGSVDILARYESVLSERPGIRLDDGRVFHVPRSGGDELVRCCGVRYRWVSEPDEGHGNALNKGFARTSGDIMAWLNSDDMYHPGAFATVAEIFTRFPDVAWLIGKYSWYDRDGVCFREKKIYKNLVDFLVRDYKWVQQESTFWRRTLWEQAGGRIDESYRFAVDGELWTRFFRYARLFHVDALLSGFRIHATNRARHNMSSVEQEMEKALQKMEETVPRPFHAYYDVITRAADDWRKQTVPHPGYKALEVELEKSRAEVRECREIIRRLEALLAEKYRGDETDEGTSAY